MNVTLVGGPNDGQSINWSGGDIIEMPGRPPAIDFSVSTVDPIRPGYQTAIYRQSLVTRSVFVYQP